MRTNGDPTRDPLIRAIEKTIATHDMLQPGDRVLVGLSGGPDSTALLLGLHQLRARLSITIGAAHLNHGLRGDRAARDARHAAGLPDHLDVSLVTEIDSAEAFRQAHR
jgi:tRNA(Ile)-lysidine synthase